MSLIAQNVSTTSGLNGIWQFFVPMLFSTPLTDMDAWQAAQVFVAVGMGDYISGTRDQQSSVTQTITSLANSQGFVSL
jgi:hypothetical protein